MRLKLFFRPLILALVMLGVGLSPANALTYNLNYGSFSGGSCNSSGFFVNAIATYTASTDATVNAVYAVNGVDAGSYSFTLSAGSGTYNTSFFFNGGSFAGNYTITFTFITQTATNTYYKTVVTAACNGGTLFMSSNGYDFFGPYQGPPIPDGFVLRPITCDVAVFDAPGGNPVGGNKITKGQTWYVSQKAVKDAKGKLWTGIFVSSYDIPYIPTECAFPDQKPQVVTSLNITVIKGYSTALLTSFGKASGGGPK